MKRWLGWLVPGALVLGAAWATDQWAPAATVDEAVRGYPWVALGLALLLAVVFHRSRLALAAGALALGVLFVTEGAPELRTAWGTATGALLLGGLALARDRGLFSPLGATQAAVSAACVAVAAFLWWETPQDVTRILTSSPLPAASLGWTGLGQVSALAYLLGLGAAAWGALRWGGPAERGLFWALVSLLVAGHAAQETTARLYLLAGGLVLGLSVLETSYAMAYRDDLTGLPARRALMRDLDALTGTYTLAMVDVDHFKKFNDRHGHDVGDQVLKMVAGRLGKASGGGRAYRYGGEEFTLVYPGRTRETATAHLERVRESVANARFSLRSWARPRKKPSGGTQARGKDRTLSVTVSLGVADSSKGGVGPEEVLKKADQALYRAKKAGRNRVAK